MKECREAVKECREAVRECREAVKECPEAVKEHFTIDGVITVPFLWPAPPSGSGPNTLHYSFDFAHMALT